MEHSSRNSGQMTEHADWFVKSKYIKHLSKLFYLVQTICTSCYNPYLLSLPKMMMGEDKNDSIKN